MSNENSVHFDSSLKPKQGILQKSHDYEEHETPQHKIKWDENKLKQDEKQKEQVTMKVTEPNTPFVRYDSISDKVTNWEDIPEAIRSAAVSDIPNDDFALDNGHSTMTNQNQEQPKLDQWDLEDEREDEEKKEKAKQKHDEFLKKRAQHYYHDGLALQQPEEKE